MVKKGLIVGAGVLLLALLFAAPFTRSHIMTWWEDGKQFVNDLESTRNQIKRAKVMIKDLSPEITRCEHVVAKVEYEVDQLREDVGEVGQDLEHRHADIMKLKGHLDNGGGTFFVGTRSYSEQRVKEDLELRFAKYKSREATRDNMEQILVAREKGLQAARKKLEEMRAAKSQLEIEVANLESRLALIEVKQTASDINIDDSALANTKELVQSIKTRIEVADKMLNADTEIQDLIPLESEDQEESNISDEIAKYFGDKGASDGNIDLATSSK